jgi:hypothetical protein
MPTVIDSFQERRRCPAPFAGPRGQVLSTRSVPPCESLDFWHDAVLATLVGMDIATVPRALLRLGEAQLAALTATVVEDTGEGAADLLLPLLCGLVEEVTRAHPARRDELARHAAEILATVALEQAGRRPAPALWERITASVQARLQDPGLTPKSSPTSMRSPCATCTVSSRRTASP